jgi:hypothetical protein
VLCLDVRGKSEAGQGNLIQRYALSASAFAKASARQEAHSETMSFVSQLTLANGKVLSGISSE